MGVLDSAVSPQQWGAVVDYDGKSWTPWIPDKFVVHWGGSPVRVGAEQGIRAEEEAQLRSWEYFHMEVQGWLGIAYNWAIGNSGTLYRLRGENRSAATSGDEEPDGIPENHEGIAVVFIIGLGQLASDAALDTFRLFYAERGLGAGIDRVIRHKDASATTCPGDQLSEWVAAGEYADDLEGENVLSIGATGPAVTDFQSALQRWAEAEGLPDPLPEFGADGDFGSETQAAVQTFQEAKQLGVNGSIDGVTGALLAPFILETATDHDHDGQYAKPHNHSKFLQVEDIVTVKRQVLHARLDDAGKPTVAERDAVVQVQVRGENA